MFQRLFRKPSAEGLNLKNVQAIFFDLDGTLVDVDMYRFIPGYLRRLTEQMRDLTDPSRATRAMHNAVTAMFANTDAGRTLETVMLRVLSRELSVSPQQYSDCLERFCRDDLAELKPLVTGHELSNDLIAVSLERGWQVVLATNPIFPRAVVDARVEWGGLDGDKFRHVTAYETAHFCKPNPAFFQELLSRLGLDARECLMVGNDPLHDLAAGQVGMQTCLLTPWSIKRQRHKFCADWQGRHEELLAMIDV